MIPPPPILFSAPMVRAILDGRKAQTRRPIKGFDKAHEINMIDGKWVASGDAPTNYGGEVQMNDWYEIIKCPYGQPGDRLVVRESWKADQIWDGHKPSDIPKGEPILYTADEHATGIVPFAWGKGRPSIFLPRWASRILLEIVSVRVERLQDITATDAWAEGIGEVGKPLAALLNILIAYPKLNIGALALSMPRDFAYGDDPQIPTDRERITWVTPRAVYAALWEAINGPGSWEANPWVWAVEFKEIGGDK